MKWTKEEHNYLVELRQKGLTWQMIAEKMTMKFGKKFRKEQCRSRWRNHRHLINPDTDPREEYPTKITKHSDGSMDIDQLIEISKTDLKDDDYILKAHGYDPEKWEITSHQFSMWNHHNKQDGTITLYASKVKIAPKKYEFNEAAIIKAIDKLPTIHIPKVTSKAPGDRPYLNVPLFDMHFGIADYDYYKPLQERILYYLEQPRKDVLFIIGQDLFHNDDFRGRTSSGREIEKVNMEQAEEDAWKFYVPLVEKAIKHSNQIHVYYSVGNHDEYAGWAFVKALSRVYGNQANFDTRFKERKVHMLGSNFIGMNHSDKRKMKKLPENFATEFPREWSMATTREVFVGHEHREEVVMVNDDGGLVLRRMSTGNIIDDWHDQMGYTTAHKRFQIFEYNENEVRDLHYV
ncbi:SANT/Myb-like DNA-binding domain-containing protein [Bacillaceae bacterium W0354]